KAAAVGDSPDTLVQLLNVLGELVRVLGDLALLLGRFIFSWALLIVWIAWWLWAVNWRKLWPVLAQGAWLPVVLLLIVAALVVSQVAPGENRFLGNFWWHLGNLGLLLVLTLFCGWLQGLFSWAPPDVDLEPPVAHPLHDGAHLHH